MDEVEDQSLNMQVAPAETPVQEIVQEQPQDDRNQRNWKELNRAKRELEQKSRMQEELIERLVRQSPSQVTPVPEIDELESIADQDYLNKNNSKKLVQKQIDPLQKRIDELESLVKRQNNQNSFNSLKTKYPDFDDVVNPETTALLEELEPELAQTIVDLKDPYKIGVQSYKYIKALNLAESVPNSRRSKEVEKKIEQNKKTVQTPQAFDKRPMAQAFKMTESEKNKLYEEMTSCAALSGSVPYIN